MDYFIPSSTEEILALKNSSINEEVIAKAIAGVVQIARCQGQTLEDLTESILQDDRVLNLDRRKWLRDTIVQAWSMLPCISTEEG